VLCNRLYSFINFALMGFREGSTEPRAVLISKVGVMPQRTVEEKKANGSEMALLLVLCW